MSARRMLYSPRSAATGSFSGFTQLQSGPPSTLIFEGVDLPETRRHHRRSPSCRATRTGHWIPQELMASFWGRQPPGNITTWQLLMARARSFCASTRYTGSSHMARNSFLRKLDVTVFRNPGSTVWNIAAQKDIPARWTHRGNAAFNLVRRKHPTSGITMTLASLIRICFTSIVEIVI